MHTQFDANTTAAAAHVIKANRPLMIWANKKYDSHYFTAKVCEKLENVRLLHVLSPDMQTDTADIFEVCLNEVRTNLSKTYDKVVILIEGVSSNMLRLALERVYKDHVLPKNVSVVLTASRDSAKNNAVSRVLMNKMVHLEI